MHFNEYQRKAARTLDKGSSLMDQEKHALEKHALHGMVSEIGELHGIYQKVYQGHGFDREHAAKELGDLLWFIAEYCTSMDWDMNDIAALNIEKLEKRYPDGFEPDRSLHRAKGDI